MCGIVGICAYRSSAPSVDANELRRIRDRMAKRGPDGCGEWISDDQRVGLGHRRLSIIDLSDRASQPMSSLDGQLVVTFNGEIYNYETLRRELETRGHIFRTQSDTEVLLHLYADQGEAMVDSLRGMFAFGIWDQRRRGLLLARDSYGIKPLYYSDDGGSIRFASQVKALVAGGGVSTEPDMAGWVGFISSAVCQSPILSTRRSPPCLQARRFGSMIAGQASLSAISPSPKAIAAPRRIRCISMRRGLQHEIREALLDSVRHHLVADVPVGAFLSAGVDSGALVGLMREAGQEDIQTVTIAFEEFLGSHSDEAPLAEQVAHHYCTRHTTRVVTEREFWDDLPRILEAMDQPSIDGINTWFVSKAAHECGLKVAISGLGGDELLGGYSSLNVPRGSAACHCRRGI